MAETPSFSTLTTKQKVIGVLTLVIIAFIIYEVIGLFSSGGSKPVAITPTPPAQPKQTGTASAPVGTAVPSAQQTAAVPILPTVNIITPPTQPINLKQEQQQQEAYLDSVNQLQLLKVKKDIAEANQAIATARLATETANKNMSDLLTQPALPQVSSSVYSNKLAGTSLSTLETGAPESIKTPPQIAEISFVVISVSMEFDHWNAILGYQGKLYTVSIGDTLLDGSTVVTINKNGVVLVKDGKRRKINIQTTI